VATLSFNVSPQMNEYIEQRVAAGEFADSDDYLRQLVRADEAKLAWLRVEIQKGLDSGISPLTVDEIIEQAFAKHEAA